MMDSGLLAARVLLATIFAVAGVAKLADRRGSRQALAGFGVPERIAAPLGTLLPFVEIAVALALLPVTTAWFGAAGALALLLTFAVAIGLNLKQGKTPECHCFGSLHSEPAGWSTLTRNGALAMVAGFVLLAGWGDAGAGVLGWVESATSTEIIVVLAGFVLLAITAWLYRDNRRLRERIDALDARLDDAAGTGGLAAGSPAPTFALADLDGVTVTLDMLRAEEKPVLLVFSDPDCSSCRTLMPLIAHWQRVQTSGLTIAVVSSGTLGANRTMRDEHSLSGVLLQEAHEVEDRYAVIGTPSAILVGTDGILGSAMANGGEAIRELVTQAVGRPAPLPGAPTPVSDGRNGHYTMPDPAAPLIVGRGEQVPRIRLPDLHGGTVDLMSLRGRAALLLFWKPDCRFSQRMLPDIKVLEAKGSAQALQLVVVSTGAVEAIRAAAFSMPVALDRDFDVARRFGVRGTPSAVLVDADGRIGSEVVTGGKAIVELARSA